VSTNLATILMMAMELPAQFSPSPVNVDGVIDAAWSRATPARITNAYDNTLAAPATCSATGEVRALWDGAVLYLLVSVDDPDVTAKDGVEFWIDHFNDKVAKFQEDDGMMTVSAPPAVFSANRPQNALYDNVSSRYLKAYASAPRADTSGYNVEIAWYLGEHARANGSKFGFDFGINEVEANGTPRCRVFWNTASRNRTTNDNREWGTVVLAGYDGKSLMQLDTFLLDRNVAKANSLVRGIWKQESALDTALARAKAATASRSQNEIDEANLALDTALRGLRRKGLLPDPYDLPEVTHLPDPFRFFDGRRVKTRADWRQRREEIKTLVQYYEFGMKPAAPAILTARSIADAQSRNITVRMSDGGRDASFAAQLTLPTAAQAADSGKSAPFPVIVSLDYAMNSGNANYLAAGYAVLSLPTAGVQSDNVQHAGAIFDLYPYDVAAGHDFGCIVGWAWGASRAVDALEYLVGHDASYVVDVKGTATPLLALDKLAITGFSRWGKGALLAGMLDERFQVTHAGASGSGGAAPYRFMPFGNEYAWGDTSGSEVLGDHLRHQTHNSNEMMRRFQNDTIPSTVQGRMYLTKTHGYGERLPFDHHLEIAAIAPRAVLIANTNDDYGNNAEGDSIGYEAAMPVFEYLGVTSRLALDVYMGGGGHSLKTSQQHNFVRFLDFVLYGIPLPSTAPPGDATNTATDVQLRKNPYLNGAKDGSSVYDVYYGGLKTMMPWRGDLR
jgi:endo-1,4-beta-xylanase